jgi:2-polyprenyl-3-methyl-5-hydroxy-6-metoxy-1,4-benzoquinol methylase
MLAHTSPCSLCGRMDWKHWSDASDIEYFTTPERFGFYECPNCRLLQIDPVPADRLGTIYPPNYYSFGSGSKGMVGRVKDHLDRRMFKGILDRMQGDNLKVLDVGGGSGWMLDLVRTASPRVGVTQVVDIDPGAQEAALHNGHRYFCGRVEDFTPGDRFDLVLLLNLIEHVADPLQVLQRVGSMLTPQGVVLVKTPNYDALDARLFRHSNWAGYHCPRHWVLFTQHSFSKLARRAGMRIESLSYTQGAPFWAASVLGWMQGLGLARVDRTRPAFMHPLFSPLLAAFAGFDLLRKPFAKTSQMFITLSNERPGGTAAAAWGAS